MIAGRWFITPHAVRQYQARCFGSPVYEKALGELIRIAESAHYVKEIKSGAELWRTGKPLRARLYVMREHDGKPQLVTVLRGCDKGDPGR